MRSKSAIVRRPCQSAGTVMLCSYQRQFTSLRGFFAQALDRIAREPLREALADALEARIT